MTEISLDDFDGRLAEWNTTADMRKLCLRHFDPGLIVRDRSEACQADRIDCSIFILTKTETMAIVGGGGRLQGHRFLCHCQTQRQKPENELPTRRLSVDDSKPHFNEDPGCRLCQFDDIAGHLVLYGLDDAWRHVSDGDILNWAR